MLGQAAVQRDLSRENSDLTSVGQLSRLGRENLLRDPRFRVSGSPVVDGSGQ